MTDPSKGNPPARRREHLLAAGVAAGLAVASGGTWLRFLLERTPRIDTRSLPFLLASGVVGASLVLAGVCGLRLASRAERLGWRALCGWACLAQVVALPALPLTSSDVYTNLGFGMLALRGLSPYAHAPAELGAGSTIVSAIPPRWVNDPSPYGPLFHPLVRASAFLGEASGSPLWGGYFAWKSMLAAALLASLAVAARLLWRRHDAHGAETFALLAFSPLLCWEVTAQGHNDGLLFLALVVFLAAAARSRPIVATVALTAGVAVKYALSPLLGLYLILTARRSLARAVVVATVALLVLVAAFAPEMRAVSLRAVMPMVGGETARHAHSLTDLVCLILDGLGRPEASRLAYRLLSVASALLCGGLLVRIASCARTLEDLAHGYLLFLLALYLTAPWFQPWYLVWGLPLLVVEPSPRWQRFFAVFALVTVGQWVAPLDPVSTVIGDAWAVWRIVRLTRQGSARLRGPDARAPAVVALERKLDGGARSDAGGAGSGAPLDR